ncbi:hypothetical protein ZIOFF_001183 [Zingiber officinale]|uniref:Uncharacterized protein n=1 Tax=Zingiber officinale TaxID=94328 RepID=A0A8J5I5I1_ZINOF|nr:hypothetical protein ZIOFF_001183 [Zingiber officinale]
MVQDDGRRVRGRREQVDVPRSPVSLRPNDDSIEARSQCGAFDSGRDAYDKNVRGTGVIMAAMERLLKIRSIQGITPEDVFNRNIAAQAIHHEFQDADEANLLEEEGYAH